MSDDAISDAGPRAATWSPGLVWPSLQIALGIGFVVIGILRRDPLALVLAGLAAVLLIATGVSQLIRRPRIEVVDGSLAIKKLSGTVFVPKERVVETRSLGVARWGARQHLMRLEYVDDRDREQLDVFARTDLGTDPRDVVDTLIRLGYGRAPAAD